MFFAPNGIVLVELYHVISVVINMSCIFSMECL